MRSYLFFFAFFVASTTFANSPVAQGDYAGSGRYIGPDGTVGTYTVTATVENDRIVTHYDYQGGSGQPEQRSVTLRFGAGGTLTVSSQDQPGAMTGRCDGELCSYLASFPGGEVMELIRFGPDRIEKVGSKKFGTVTITWSETLSRGE